MEKIALIIAAGPNLGTNIAAEFADNGYKVAVASRTGKTTSDTHEYFHVKTDLSDPEAVPEIFRSVASGLGTPNVVIYNGANRQLTPPEDPLSVPLSTLDSSRKVGLDSAYVAAQEALKGFRTLPEDVPKAFIYTGNMLSQIAMPPVMPFALGKVAAMMLIEYCANAYGKDGYKFYYMDERQPSGKPMGSTDGTPMPRHAEMYLTIAHEVKQSKWLVTWVHGEGRKEFGGIDLNGETRADYDRKFGR